MNGQLTRLDEVRVAAGQAHRLAAAVVDQADDLLVDLADQDHLDHVHGLAVGDPHALHVAGRHLHLLEKTVDLWAAAVDDHRVDADVLHEDHVQGETAFEFLLDHGVTAVLDHHRAAAELAHVGQRLHQHLGLGDLLAHLPPVSHSHLLVSAVCGACSKTTDILPPPVFRVNRSLAPAAKRGVAGGPNRFTFQEEPSSIAAPCKKQT